MTTFRSARQRQLVTRRVLLLVSEGVPGLEPSAGRAVALSTGCLTLLCAGSEMTAEVELQCSARDPGLPGVPWHVLLEHGEWLLTSGHLGLGNIEGLLEWFDDVGLGAGIWNVRASTTGTEQAAALDEQLLADDESDATIDRAGADGLVAGPERWLVQLWRPPAGTPRVDSEAGPTG